MRSSLARVCLATAVLLVASAGQADDGPMPLSTLYGHEKGLLSLAFSRDSKRLATGSAEGKIKVWDTAGDEVQSFDFQYSISGIAFSKDGNTLATGSWGAQLWDLPANRRTDHLESHTGFVTCCAYSPNGKLLATGGLDSTVKLFDTVTKQEIKSLPHADQVNCLAFSADGKWLAFAGDTTVKVVDVSSWREVKSFKMPVATSLAFSPSGKILALGCADKLIHLWDTDEWKEDRTLKGHTEKVMAAAFSPDGRWLATGSADKTVRLWDAATWQEKHGLKDHLEAVSCLAFSPDGKWLATGSLDATAKIWAAPK
jgi:WD40 repeat protein